VHEIGRNLRSKGKGYWWIGRDRFMTGEETSHVGKNDQLEWRDISPMKELLMCCDIAPDEIN
jgi:hypothetical protein